MYVTNTNKAEEAVVRPLTPPVRPGADAWDLEIQLGGTTVYLSLEEASNLWGSLEGALTALEYERGLRREPDEPLMMRKSCEFCGNPATMGDEATPDTCEPCYWNQKADDEFWGNWYKPRYVVAVWGAERAYGGPEEGGWYYDTRTLLKSVECATHEAAYQIREALESEYPSTGKRWSVLGGEDYDVTIEDRHGYSLGSFDERLDLLSFTPTRRPHYE